MIPGRNRMGSARFLTREISLNLLLRRQSIGIFRIKINISSGNLAKRVDDHLVVLARRGAIVALHELFGSLRDKKNQREPVGHLF